MTTEANALASEEIEVTSPDAVDNAADTPKPEGDETGANADPAQTDAETAAAEGEKDGDPEKAKKPNRKPAGERIAELIRARHDAEKRAEKAEARLKELEGPAPKRADYKDPDDFEADRAKWAAKAARGDEAKHEATTARAEAETAAAEKWNASREDAQTRFADFNEVIAAVPGDVFTPTVAKALLESDMAADVAYVLAKDLPRARQFAAMTPHQQGREIGRIEAELTPKPRKISSTPPPVETLGTRGAGSAPDPSKMSMDEYAKWRKSQKD
ncbi:hypothetical protein [Devosia sp. 2618]|uniref:hypothetical protein n=1 Tax=Devosia sp. 2618 TaxID=3156454 RepID=UPI003395F8B2